MNCPNCKEPTKLLITERKGVEIDYCPECRGVWLDRGELDKIIAQDSNSREEVQSPRPEYRDERERRDREYENRGGYGYGNDYRKPKRKKSFLEELFD